MQCVLEKLTQKNAVPLNLLGCNIQCIKYCTQYISMVFSDVKLKASTLKTVANLFKSNSHWIHKHYVSSARMDKR